MLQTPIRNPEDYPEAVSDRQDTIRRIAALGQLVNLTSEAEIVKLADVLLSLDRARLLRTRDNMKRQLGDWTQGELDKWWGALLQLRRIQGIDDTGNILSDALFSHRIRTFMLAANQGVSVESVRLAAEAGGGVPFRATKNEGRIILVPMENITPAQRAHVFEAVRRVAPAKLSFEIGEYESWQAETPLRFLAESTYVGVAPSMIGASGPTFDTPNFLAGAYSRQWQAAEVGSLYPTDGVPSNLPTGGVWHTGPLGAGSSSILEFNAEVERVTNRVSFMLSPGAWGVELRDSLGVLINRSTVFADGWRQHEVMHSMEFRTGYSVKITNLTNGSNALFLKDLYMGSRVSEEYREQWIALGQETGKDNVPGVITADTDGIGKGGSWMSQMNPTRDGQETLIVELQGIPVTVSALSFATEAPGPIFQIDISTQNTSIDEITEWASLPGNYRLVNGRVSIYKCVARFLRLRFTNLVPMQLREWHNET